MTYADPKIVVNIRVNAANIEWYRTNFPGASAFPDFVNQCLSDFRIAWGDRPTPDQIAARVAGKLISQRGF